MNFTSQIKPGVQNFMSDPDGKSGLELAVEAIGQAKKLAEMLDITPQAVSQWKQIPHDRVIAVERLTGIHRGRLRPDLYPPELPSVDLVRASA
ncbi:MULTISPECIES: Cro/CI family transcriptional regulator [unclassified Mesorhizobium]|uniref:transcriptional regulator n=1 Tax=unclassified Mesorhizobium TaxID=325217 RepID=UPI001FDA8DBE|nr:Cro/CI family transcriptional regulator [Mesorhizobium sp. L2C054A000]